jgi:predicted component of type VI protein secretion system
MALDLRISGPGLDVLRRLEPTDPALILGRDSDCAVCLPDPERNVSRRHLKVWNHGDQLHFHVLSAVNGVVTGAGELPPGARGILAPGDVLGLSAFRIQVAPATSAPAPQPAAAEADPWSEFERAAAKLVPDTTAETVPGVVEDDPFGDWGFQSTFGPGSPTGSVPASALQPASDLHAFFSGLGLEPGGELGFTHGELEAMGRITRIAVQGLLQAAEAAAAARQTLAPAANAAPRQREKHPLRGDSPVEDKLYYLFGGKAAAAGPLAPDRAVAQVATELAAHEQAMADAVRELLRQVLEEFDPEALKQRLLAGSPRIFESARAWDAFARDYAQRLAGDPSWVQQLLDRHFAPAYAAALVRAKRNTQGRS